jgi:hypothetical protein
LAEYLPLVRELLVDIGQQAAAGDNLDESIVPVFRRLVLATAWQESCWRQFEVKDRKVVTLRSSSGDSGLMQLNEKVWRGLYDMQKLRWDPAYNARAGAEVLRYYLVKYAIRRGEHEQPGGLENLARATYSAYNGGPSRTARYRDPDAPARLKKIDAAFWEKYQAVSQGREMQVAQCLGVDPAKLKFAAATEASAPAQLTPSRPQATSTAVTAGGDQDSLWLLAQDPLHYTVQLAAFASRQAAQDFRRRHGSQGRVVRIDDVRNKQPRFVVVDGSFANRAGAEKQRLKHDELKPWIRQFKDLQVTAAKSG